MKVLALVAQKGGAGKTTLAVNLAVAAQQAGERVLVIDLDPQASACAWGDRRGSAEPAVLDAQPARLTTALQKAAEAGVTLAVVDTPARVEQGAQAASMAADLVVIPCTPSVLGVETLRATADLVAPRAKAHPVVVLNAVSARGDRADQAEAAIKGLGLTVCPARIVQRVAFEHAALAGLGVMELPHSPAVSEVQALWAYIRGKLYPYTGRKSGAKDGSDAQGKARSGRGDRGGR